MTSSSILRNKPRDTWYDRVAAGGGARAHVGDIIATRRNDRQLTTDVGEPVRNREPWTVLASPAASTVGVTYSSSGGGPLERVT